MARGQRQEIDASFGEPAGAMAILQAAIIGLRHDSAYQ
jgi:hypothetical protein